MSWKPQWGYKVAVLFLSVALLLSVATACSGDDDGEETTTTPSTSTTTATTTGATTTEASGKPVKIGAISAWSGNYGMAGPSFVDPILDMIEEMVNESGGVLDSRPIEFVKFDSVAETAKALAGVRKLAQEGVSVIAVSGNTQAEALAIQSEAEKQGVLIVLHNPVPEDLSDSPYAVRIAPSTQNTVDTITRTALDVVGAETISFLYVDVSSHREINHPLWVEGLEEADVELHSPQFHPADVTNMEPYMTRVKYEDPDALIFFGNVASTMSAAQNIPALGGLGDTVVLSGSQALLARNFPGTEGWYVQTLWMQGMDHPGSKTFEEAFNEKFPGKTPDPNHVFIWNDAWTAIEAIKLADSDDPKDVAKAARSGDLVWDTPMGTAHFTPDGESNLSFTMVRIEEGGELTAIELPGLE